ncbi:MAG: di-trans,poly-cis-decaprenylcistransferase [Planctomycetes bacterium]|nr:di-trans,poly-cis-decaprenylcistransferase [Planctomycetota bacterium]
MPQHVAVIMDGNGRWAASRGLPRLAGHEEGARSVRKAVELFRKLAIPYLTLYAFSTENWGRPAYEVAGLMKLLARWARSEREELRKERVSVRLIGQPDRLARAAREELHETVRATAVSSPVTVLTLALSYGGRSEVARAAARVARAVLAGTIDPEELEGEGGEEILARHLDTAGTPDPDLVIRTGGEIRTSNFLLFQSAYSEWIFRATPWPEFREEAFLDCFAEFASRRRRFGLTDSQVSGEVAKAPGVRVG